MRHIRCLPCSIVILLFSGCVRTQHQAVEPPYWASIYVDTSIIMVTDPSAYQGLAADGPAEYWLWDATTRQDEYTPVHAFHATWNDISGDCLALVDTSFADLDSAFKLAELYGRALGRVPARLRTGVRGFYITGTDSVFSCSFDSIINIHHGQGLSLIAQNILEETFVHESTHAALDPSYATKAKWVMAQKADGQFISHYAMENPTTEDLAETALFWMALKFVPWRVSVEDADTINATVPHRLKFLNFVPFNAHPIGKEEADGPLLPERPAATIDSGGDRAHVERVIAARVRFPCGGRVGTPDPRERR